MGQSDRCSSCVMMQDAPFGSQIFKCVFGRTDLLTSPAAGAPELHDQVLQVNLAGGAEDLLKEVKCASVDLDIDAAMPDKHFPRQTLVGLSTAFCRGQQGMTLNHFKPVGLS